MAPTSSNSAPSLAPPQEAAAAAGTGQGAPTLSLEEIGGLQTRSDRSAAPTLPPPAEALAAGDTAIGAWHNSVRITALWCNAGAVNAWAAIDGVGWRRVVATNENAFLNIVAMLSHARQMNVTANVRIDADNLIHEAYVW